MTPFVYVGEVVFCLTMIAYLLAALVGTVCFAMSVSYRLKVRYVLPEVVISAASVWLSAICRTESGSVISGKIRRGLVRLRALCRRGASLPWRRCCLRR